MASTDKVLFAPAYKDVALAGVYEISKILTGAQSLERTLGAVIAVLSSFMQMRRGFILALDEDGEPEITASSDASPKPNGAKTLLPQKVIDHIVATGVPLVIEDISSHSYFTGTAYRHLLPPMTKVSFLGVPIKVDGLAKGTLTVDREWNNKLDFRLEDDVRMLTMVANLIGQSMRMHALIARDRDRLIKEQHRLEKQLTEVRHRVAEAVAARKIRFHHRRKRRDQDAAPAHRSRGALQRHRAAARRDRHGQGIVRPRHS